MVKRNCRTDRVCFPTTARVPWSKARGGGTRARICSALFRPWPKDQDNSRKRAALPNGVFSILGPDGDDVSKATPHDAHVMRRSWQHRTSRGRLRDTSIRCVPGMEAPALWERAPLKWRDTRMSRARIPKMGAEHVRPHVYAQTGGQLLFRHDRAIQSRHHRRRGTDPPMKFGRAVSSSDRAWNGGTVRFRA